jgi:nicotinate-nucleotide pyrophosphorylase (carboxylating)
LPEGTDALLRRALREDRFGSDVTTLTLFPRRVPARAVVTAQAPGVASGVAAAARVAQIAGLTPRRAVADGSPVRGGTPVLVVEGDARRILSAERTMLNFLMHLSGIATATRRAVRAVGRTGARMEVRGTRKTLPGLRDLEKQAIVHGGGRPHRRDLATGILLKNNHLALLPVPEALARLRGRRGPRPRIEVEVRRLGEARAALRAGAEELLVDNLRPLPAQHLISAIRSLPGGAKVLVEVSGGVTPENIARYARSGADAASLGSLTHSARALPFHLTLLPPPRRTSR